MSNNKHAVSYQQQVINFDAGWKYCIYYVNCTNFGKSILTKIIKIVATRYQILRLKCIKFEFGWGCTPDPAGGAYSAPPDSLAGFKGAYF